MVGRRWYFTGLEFAALWDDMREYRLPTPFSLTCRIPLYQDFLRAKREARAEARDRLGSGFEDVLSIIAQPDIRLVVEGRDLNAADAIVRMHAVRRGGDGYLVEQLPGEPGEQGGMFVVDECEVLELGKAIVDRLPSVEAGHTGAIDLATHLADQMDYEHGRPLTRDTDTENEIMGRAVSFLRRPLDHVGLVEIIQGIARFGPRHRVRRVIQWRDLTDDGRYVVVAHNDYPMAFGVSSRRFAATIDTVTAEVVAAIRDERR